MDKREFIRACTKTLKAKGFKRLKNNFVLKLKNDITVLVWIHRSFFENSYYIEFAFSFKQLDRYAMRISIPDYYKMDLRCGRMNFSFGRANEIYYTEIMESDFVFQLSSDIDEILEIAKDGKEKITKVYIKDMPISRAILRDSKVAEFLGVEGMPNVRISK